MRASYCSGSPPPTAMGRRRRRTESAVAKGLSCGTAQNPYNIGRAKEGLEEISVSVLTQLSAFLSSQPRSPQEFFVLDIGSSSVKALQLRPHSGGAAEEGTVASGWAVVGAGHWPVGRAMMAERRVQESQQEALAEVIGQALERARLAGRRVALSMPTAQTASRILTIPGGMGVIEEEDFIQGEVEKTFSVDLDSVQWDFEVLGAVHDPENADAEGQVFVLLTISKKDVFQTRRDTVESTVALHDLGMRVEIADVEEYAMERALADLIRRHPHPDQNAFPPVPVQEDTTHPGRVVLDANVLARLRGKEGDLHMNADNGPIEILVDLGHETSTLYAMYGNKIIYSNESDHGLKPLVDELARHLSLPIADAQTALINQSLPAAAVQTYESDLLPRFRTDVTGQVNRLIQNFFAALSINRVHRIWLAGGGAALDGVAAEVEETTGIPTLVANPLHGCHLERSVDEEYIAKFGPLFLLAYGLAIRSD